jgi:ABC-type microcin C transport system permease subunit YejE
MLACLYGDSKWQRKKLLRRKGKRGNFSLFLFFIVFLLSFIFVLSRFIRRIAWEEYPEQF